jgi:hypothetical protein
MYAVQQAQTTVNNRAGVICMGAPLMGPTHSTVPDRSRNRMWRQEAGPCVLSIASSSVRDAGDQGEGAEGAAVVL